MPGAASYALGTGSASSQRGSGPLGAALFSAVADYGDDILGVSPSAMKVRRATAHAAIDASPIGSSATMYLALQKVPWHTLDHHFSGRLAPIIAMAKAVWCNWVSLLFILRPWAESF